MKIFSVQQIHDADKYTIAHEPITSVDLMERAANACVKWIVERFDNSTEFKVVCGLGNNGGDGLAIARLLAGMHYHIDVFIVRHTEKELEDFQINLKRLREVSSVSITELTELSDTNVLIAEEGRGEVIIDALLGSGINKPVEGVIAGIINYINHSQAVVVSIDAPSGLYCDKLNSVEDILIKADYTLTFQSPKLSFMFPETADCVGQFSVLDIGLHSQYIYNTPATYNFITKNELLYFFKKRHKVAHKGNFGHALIVAGSFGKMGAAVLSAKACLRAGVGLLTARIPGCGYTVMQTAVAEAMTDTDSETNFITGSIQLEKYHAIGIGPGIGTEQQTQNVVKMIIQNSHVPVIFDADAINCIAENKTWLSFIPANSILTPHPKEFERLTGKGENSEDRLKMQREFSMRYKTFVVLKGAHTSVSCPDGSVYFNSTGNPGMATAGSGDVLTGIITSLLAQGYTSLEACTLGVYLHGLAGDFAAMDKSEESMVASDITEHLTHAFKFFHK